MKTVIRTKNLSKNYGKTTVLKNIDLIVSLGEFTAIMGPSGSGKSTLMKENSVFTCHEQTIIRKGNLQ